MELATTENQKNAWWREMPFPFTACEVNIGTRPEGFRFYPYIINIEAQLFGKPVHACGEAFQPEAAMTKAVAELLERAALLSWKAKHGILTSSNGWAAHSARESAHTAAVLELIERDAALAQWYTATPFIEIPYGDLPGTVQSWQQSELAKSEFPILKILLSTEGLGPSVTCLFLNKSGYGVSSHSTRKTLEESIHSAIGEACRAAHMALRKSFWRETLAMKNGEDVTVSPGAHSVYYAYHENFPDWITNETIGWKSAVHGWNGRIELALSLPSSFEVVLEQPVVVGHATLENALPLTWGTTKLEAILNMSASKRFAGRTSEWNLKPHIIS